MLTEMKVRNAKPADKPYKLADAGGLHLHVAPSGHRSWRWRYQRDGKEKLVVLGEYPAMSLREARDARDQKRQELRQPPAPEMTPSPPLEEVVVRWHATNSPRWKPHHAADVLAGLKAEVLVTLGGRAIDTLTAADLLGVLRPVQSRSVDIARRLRGRLESVFAFAIGEGLIRSNPAAEIAKAMAPLVRSGHRPAAVTIEAAREALALMEGVAAYPLTRLCLRFVALTAVRPGEAAAAEWREIEDGVWRIPGPRMKMGRDHVVPLSRQAAEALAAARPLSGRAPFVFPSASNARQPLSENALNVLLRRAGLQGVHVPHGWRATFSTVMNERFPADRAAIDLMLAHAPKDQVEAAYNRAQHMERRRELAQAWADLLLEGAPAAVELVGMRRK